MKTKFLLLGIASCLSLLGYSQINLLTLFDYTEIKNNQSLLGDGLVHPATDVDRQIAKNGLEIVPGTFTIGTTAIPLKALRVEKAAILSMKTLANAIASCANSVPAVEIIYGVNSGTFTMYYTPILLCHSDDKYGYGGTRYGHYIKVASGNYYTYTEGAQAFTPTTPAAVTTATNIYQGVNGIKIKRPDNSITGFQSGTTIAGDVKSILYPIEQFERICDADTYFYIWNSVHKMKLYVNATDEVEYTKHTLMLSSKQFTINSAGTSVDINNPALRFGDLGHICPPSCYSDEFTFIMGTTR